MQVNNFKTDKLTIDELFNRSKQYKNSDELFQFVNFITKFRHYSYFNTMLMYIQNNSVDFFGGASYWEKKFDRKVKKGAKPYIILQPFGPIMLVYDIFETEGELSPQEFLEQGLGKPLDVKGILNPEILSKSLEVAKNYGIKVSHKPLSFFNAGYITTIFKGTLEIALKEGMSFEQDLAVLIHELAHLFLGHTGHETLKTKTKDGKLKVIKLMNRKLSRTAEELEAETISYLICKKIGLETRSEKYLASYITCNKDLEEFSYELVIKTADKIEGLFFKRLRTAIQKW